jgi:hypothetical protein
VVGPGISEDQLHRLSGVSRQTRQNWEKAGVLEKRTPPFSLVALREVVVLSALRALLVPSIAEIAFRQLRDTLPAVAGDGVSQIEVIVDLCTGRAEWLRDDQHLAEFARRGTAVHVIDITRSLARANEGFDLIARATAPTPDDELAGRRTRARTARKGRGAQLPG